MTHWQIVDIFNCQRTINRQPQLFPISQTAQTPEEIHFHTSMCVCVCCAVCALSSFFSLLVGQSSAPKNPHLCAKRGRARARRDRTATRHDDDKQKLGNSTGRISAAAVPCSRILLSTLEIAIRLCILNCKHRLSTHC